MATAVRVSVAYNGQEDERYLGVVLGLDEDGNHRVRYDDDEEQEGVASAWIRYVETLSPSRAHIGQRIEAPFDTDNEGRIYPGRIKTVDGTVCDIEFDDGDEVKGIALAKVMIEANTQKDHPSPSKEDSALWDALAASDEEDDEAMMREVPENQDFEEDKYDDDDDFMQQDENVSPILPEKKEENDKQILHSLVLGSKLKKSFLEQAVESALTPPRSAFSEPYFVDKSPQEEHFAFTREEAPEDDAGADGWGYSAGNPIQPAPVQVPNTQLPTSGPPALCRQISVAIASLQHWREATAETRLSAVLYRCAVLEVERENNEFCGKSWQLQSSGLPCTTLASRALGLDALLELRMRAVALVRICSGTHSIQTLEAVLDLAQAYAQRQLWHQARSHAERGLALLRKNVSSAHFIDSTKPLNESSLETNDALSEVLDRLQCLAMARGAGALSWAEVRRMLASSRAGCLADMPWGIRQGNELPDDASFAHDGQGSGQSPGYDHATWAEIITFLRLHHAGYCAAVRCAEQCVPLSLLCLLKYAFETFTTGGQHGVILPTALRAALVKLPRAATALGPVSGFAGWLARQCDRQLASDYVPLTWEQCVCALARLFGSFSEERTERRLRECKCLALHLSGRAALVLGESSRAMRLLRSAETCLGESALPNAAAVRAALADVLVTEHCKLKETREKEAREKAQQWLESDDGRQLLRAEVKRLLAEMRRKGTPGVVPLTRPQLERRARDVLFSARLEHCLQNSRSNEAADSDALAEAQRQLELALAAELATYGGHRHNFRAFVATAALGNLAIVTGNQETAKAKLSDAHSLMLAANDGAYSTVSAAVATQLGRLLSRRSQNDDNAVAHAAQILAAVADFYLGLARSADTALVAEEENYNKNNLALECASQARTNFAKKSANLWTEVSALLDKQESSDGGLLHANSRLLEATKLAEGATSLASLRMTRKVAKIQIKQGKHKDAAKHYRDMQRSALKLGAVDIAHKAAKARTGLLLQEKNKIIQLKK